MQSSDASLPTVGSPHGNRYSAKSLFPSSSSSSRDSRVDSSRGSINLKSHKSTLGVSLPFISQDGNGAGNSIRWKRAEVLGQGAFGVVYLGLNLDSGELMAVKHMNYSLEDMSRKELTSLENEINMLRSFRHPNIVRYIGTELSTDNTLCIFLEYISGGSIKTLINKFGPLNESVVKSYSRQLLLGLEYLHRNGIAHRDIKGANCLVSNDGVIKLSDFGASKYYWKRPELVIPKGSAAALGGGSGNEKSLSVETVGSSMSGGTGTEMSVHMMSLDSARDRTSSTALSEDDEVDFILTQTHNPRDGGTGHHHHNHINQQHNDVEDHNTGNDIKGTPCWIAPEVVKNENNAEVEMNWRKADIWSLACTCIEMSTGRPPWSQFDNPVTILYHLACSENIPDYPQDISMEYINFLSVCLQRDTVLRADVTSLLLHPFVLVNGWGGTAMMRPTTVGGTHNEDGRGTATSDYDLAPSRVSSSLWSRVGSSYSRNGGTSGSAIPAGGLGLLASRGSAVNTASRLLFTPTKGVIPNTIEEDHSSGLLVDVPTIPQIGDMIGTTISAPGGLDMDLDIGIGNLGLRSCNHGTLSVQSAMRDADANGQAETADNMRIPVTVGGGYDSGDDEVLEDLDEEDAEGDDGDGDEDRKMMEMDGDRRRELGDQEGGSYSPELGLESFANTGMQDFEHGDLDESKADRGLRSIKAGFKSARASRTDNVVVLEQKKPAGGNDDGKHVGPIGPGAVPTNIVEGLDLMHALPYCNSPKPAGGGGRDKRKGTGRGKLTSLSTSSGSPGGAFTKHGAGSPSVGAGDAGVAASLDMAMSISSWGSKPGASGCAEEGKRGSGQRYVGLVHKSTGNTQGHVSIGEKDKTRMTHMNTNMNNSASQSNLDGLSGVGLAVNVPAPLRFHYLDATSPSPQPMHEHQHWPQKSAGTGPGSDKSQYRDLNQNRGQNVGGDEDEIEDLSDQNTLHQGAESMHASAKDRSLRDSNRNCSRNNRERYDDDEDDAEEISDGEDLPSEYARDANGGRTETDTETETQGSPLKEHQRVSVLSGHVGPVSKLRSPSKVDAALLSCGHDGTVRLWNCKTSQQALVLTQSESGTPTTKLTSLYANDMCSEIWAAGATDGAVYMWSGLGSGNGKSIRKFNMTEGRSGSSSSTGSGGPIGVTCMEGLEPTGMAMQDSCLVATGSNDKTIRLWDQRAKKALVRVLKGHTDSVQCLQWLPSQRVLISGSKDKTIRLWDIRTGKTRLVLEKHFGTVSHLSLLPNWNAGSRQQVFAGGGFDMSVPAGPTCFVSGARDGMLSVWDSMNGSCLQTTAAHRGTVTSLGQIPYNIGYNNCSLLYSAGSDGIVKLWEASFRTGKPRSCSTGVSLSCMAELNVGYNAKVMYNHNLSTTQGSGSGTTGMNGGLYTASTTGNSVLLWRPSGASGTDSSSAPSSPSSSRHKREQSQSSGSTHQSTVIAPSGITPQYQFQQKPVSVGKSAADIGSGTGSGLSNHNKTAGNGYWRSEEVGQSLSSLDGGPLGVTDMQTVAVAIPTAVDPGGNASVLAVSSKSGLILLYQQIVQ